MNTIKRFVKYNWHPLVISSSFMLHSSMLYYNESYKGTITNSPIIEGCTSNSHVFYGGSGITTCNFPLGIIMMPFVSLLFGETGIFFSIYDTYINLQMHKKHKEPTKFSCLCGKI